MFALATQVAAPSRSIATSARVQSLFLAGIDTRPTNVYGALASLHTLTVRLRAVGDARAVFPEVYGVITRRVADAIVAGGVFLEPDWIARLAGRFAERYFEALAASLTDETVESGAWALAFEAGRVSRRVPVRDALLGINAHINYDLAQGIADNIRAAGHAGDVTMLARYRHDHDAVNAILLAAMPDIYDILLTRYACPVTWVATRSRRANALFTRAAMSVLAGWRAQVWDDMLLLLRAEDEATHRDVLATLDRRSRRVARVLANPVWLA